MQARRAEQFNWALVRSFLAILEAGSMKGAARQLHAHQPTLSRHLAELEAQLGAPLFERTGAGVVPTAMALAIADDARQMLASAQAMHRTMASRSQATTGSVRITTSQVAAAYLLPPVLAELQAAEPGIAVDLVASDRITNLLRREADIAVRMLRPTQASLIARKLGMMPIVAAAHQSYLQRAGTPHQPADLQHHRLIGYDSDDTIMRGFAAAGFTTSRDAFAVRTDDQVAYGRLVASGAGIGFVAHYNLVHWPGVVPLLPMLRIAPLPCWLAVHREIRSTPVIRRVYDFLADSLPAYFQVA